MNLRPLLFLGGLGAPAQIYLPWFAVFRKRGYDVHLVPNTAFCLDPASTFAGAFVEMASRHDGLDVIGVSYGGNAALYGAYLSAPLRAKIGKMILVASPIGGVPLLRHRAVRLVASRFSEKMEEMLEGSEIVTRLLDPRFHREIGFELHCIYHPRDLTAPPRTATLEGVGTNHRLQTPLTGVPSILVHDAVFAHPATLRTVLDVLGRPWA
jgi:pimeloyl-ACP methyl ester carboxylesterase